ncbi:NUDIX domain-containing protein [Peribacillus muralis]|uniref:NUDIX hydrolase n=1 Tax=Peribacillus muralis TaxID=264697 RepID=UPI001F4D7C0B|nr:NUDIX domain-containing protein [Peribacillus muralis]MCK2012712.1 NUDIX domain-containing protein [Peribacillus muralis]
MRNRGSIILKVKDKVALIRRCREGTAYYVFPGGGIEKAETPEQAGKREAFEELGVKVEVKDCLAVVPFNGIQYFFLGDIIEGVLGTGNGEEYNDSERGTYQPMWVMIEDLATLDVRPKEVAEKVLSLYKSTEK